jgi:hypothetical protein
MTPTRGKTPARPRSLCGQVVVQGTGTGGDAARGMVPTFSYYARS